MLVSWNPSTGKAVLGAFRGASAAGAAVAGVVGAAGAVKGCRRAMCSVRAVRVQVGASGTGERQTGERECKC